MRISNPSGLRAIGGRWNFGITINDGTGAPLDLTGGTVTAMLKSGTTIVHPATAMVPADQATATGRVGIVFLPSETAQLSFGRVRYEVRLSFDADHSDIVAAGFIQAIKTVL